MFRIRFPLHCGTVAALSLVTMILSGCGGGGPSAGPAPHRTKGVLLDKGKPVRPDANSSITLVFTQVVEKGQFGNSYPTSADPADGTFEVKGPDELGIPPGKYRVKLSSLSMNPSAAIKSLNDRFGTDSSPILVDVVDEKTPITIDISNLKSK